MDEIEKLKQRIRELESQVTTLLIGRDERYNRNTLRLAELELEIENAPVVYGGAHHEGQVICWTTQHGPSYDTHQAKLVRIERIK